MAPLIGTYCGNRVPPYILSTGNQMTIEFVTDDISTGSNLPFCKRNSMQSTTFIKTTHQLNNIHLDSTAVRLMAWTVMSSQMSLICHQTKHAHSRWQCTSVVQNKLLQNHKFLKSAFQCLRQVVKCKRSIFYVNFTQMCENGWAKLQIVYHHSLLSFSLRHYPSTHFFVYLPHVLCMSLLCVFTRRRFHF